MERGSEGENTWLVLTDMLTSRIFFECRIVDQLLDRLGPRLELIVLVQPQWVSGWLRRTPGARVTFGQELFPWKVGLAEKVARRADSWLDRQIGFFPLAIRFNLRNSFHLDRMQPDHGNWFLDSARLGLLPQWDWVEHGMLRWHFSTRRYTSHTLVRRMRSECRAVVLSNLQSSSSVPFLTAARRLGRPTVGYIASWDHAVGKGVVSPHVDRYVVQNETMVNQLARYHGIGPDRVVVTGWPQTDLYHRRRPRAEYETLLQQFGLDPARPVVVFAGNTLTNAPREGELVKRLVQWWLATGADARFQFLFRPHPRLGEWPEWFSAPVTAEGLYVQSSSYDDMENLATLLQHVDCVVANAGTILLEAIVNDRPAVCVLYDEGAPLEDSWARKNVAGEHYHQLMASGAFYRAESFEEVTAGIERALMQPLEFTAQRAQAARNAVGEVDGRAVERIVDSILSVHS